MVDNHDPKNEQGTSNGTPQKPTSEAALESKPAFVLKKPDTTTEKTATNPKAAPQPPFITLLKARWYEWRAKRRGRERAKLTDKIIGSATVVIALMAVLQWLEMRGSGRQTEKIIATANEIKCALITANRQNLQNANDSLGATIAQNRLDQRPWVTANGFFLSEEPAFDKEIRVKVKLINTGKTPAIEVMPGCAPSLRPTAIPPADFSHAKMVSRGVVPPGTTDASFTCDPMTVNSTIQIASYENGLYRVYVEALISYKDTFNRPHWTRLCAYHTAGMKLNEFDYCEHGNDMDKEPEPSKNPN